MSYNKGRITVSIKDDSKCNICEIRIKKGEEIYIIPGKYIAHLKCHLKSQDYINDKA